MSRIKQVKIKEENDSSNDKNNKNNKNNKNTNAMMDIGIDIDIDNENNIDKNNKNTNAMMDIGIDIDIDNEDNIDKGTGAANPKDNNLRRRKDIISSIPGGCSAIITDKVKSSLYRLCIFCWILSISSPLALIFSLIYCRNLKLSKKYYEYF